MNVNPFFQTDPGGITAASEPVPPVQPSPTHPGDRMWIWILGAAILLFLTAWLWLTPAGFWGKLQAIGYVVCHQLEEHSFFLPDHQFPLCARCTGLYLGVLLSLAFQLLQGRKGKFPPIGVLIVLALLFLGFALDGTNSLLQKLPGIEELYQPQNWLRLLTGMGAGICIGAVLAPMINQTLWANWQAVSSLDTWFKTVALLFLAGMLTLGILFDVPWLRYLAAVLSGLGVFVLLSLIYTLLAVIILKRENLYQHWRELLLPALLGIFTAILQISLTDLLRFLITDTWGALNL
ncbi:MAG: DUF2085 domain-containing protein [Anaerolineaceae bacterium]